jgi:hypothetical protein
MGTRLLMNYRRGVCQPGAVGMCASATESAFHWLDAQVPPASPVSHLPGRGTYPTRPISHPAPLARCFQLRPAMESNLNPGRPDGPGRARLTVLQSHFSIRPGPLALQTFSPRRVMRR